MSSTDPIVISSYARTPMGGLLGALKDMKATELGSIAVKGAIERSGIAADAVERIYMGCVVTAGLGMAPARQAGLGAGLSQHAEATTVNKMCGSGMQSAIMAADALSTGNVDIIVAGGMESMTNAPYLMAKHREGARLGHDVLKDAMFLDGLEDAYDAGKPMGAFAEDAVREYQFTRSQQDEYALRSLERAKTAISTGAFVKEIVAVNLPGKNGGVFDTDEAPGKARPEKIPSLKPAFLKDGTITPANSSSISDGAAAMVLARASTVEKHGMKAVARIVSYSAHAQAPAWFTTAPVPAIRKVMEKAGWTVDDVDLFEVNEAFAVVAMIAAKEIGIPAEKLNVNGGACALGHPIGASGARILATLLSALEARGLKRGIGSLCIGGGEAVAMAVELI